MRYLIYLAALGLALPGCTHSNTLPASPEVSPAAQAYHDRLSSLCNGAAYAGKLVTRDAVDADFGASKIIMGPALCSEGLVEIPLAVGDDRSRIWQIRLTDTGVRLKHDHSHADGTKDAVTQYGGDSFGDGTVERQVFPVDAETRVVFTREDIAVSNQNNWAMEIVPENQFVYEMWRPNRHFRLEFDLTNPVPAPPAPWALVPIK